MAKYTGRGFGIVFLMVGAIIFVTLSLAQGQESPKARERLSSIGRSGDQAVPLKAWMEQSNKGPLKPGDPIVVHLVSREKAYLTALYESSGGNVLILVPNAQWLDTKLQPDKEYTLFGEDSEVKLKASDKMKDAELIFFVTSKPIALDALKPESGKSYTSIPLSSTDQMKILRAKIEDMAKDEKFNKVVLSLNSGAPFRKMGLPSAVKSDSPETMTGVQGMKPEMPSLPPPMPSGR